MAKRKKKAKTRRTRRVKRAPKRRRSMARRRKGYRKKNKAIPIAIVGPPAAIAVNDIMMGGGPVAVANRMVESFTGYNIIGQKWTWDEVKPLLFAEIAGVVAHKVANRVGLNKHIRKLTFGYLEI